MKLFFPLQKEIKNLEEIEILIKFNATNLFAFDDKIIDFIASLSNAFLKNKTFAKIPPIAAFGFWIRKANLTNMLNSAQFSDSVIPVPRGIVFHIAPSNVDYMFLYSWFISVLAGNKNILRLSSKTNSEVILVIEFIAEFAKSNNAQWFLDSNLILTYDHTDSINNTLSSVADCRIFWGGDETIKRMRKFDSKPTVKDIYFSDKFSYSVINSEKFNKLSEKEYNLIANNFYNDSYIFDQKACSSPQVLFFAGDELSNRKASSTFWTFFNNVLISKQENKSAAVVIEHFLNWSILASKSKTNNFDPSSTKPTVVNMPISEISSSYRTCGGGFYIESYINNLNDLLNFGSYSDQTLTYFGFTNQELKEYILAKGSKSNLRIVPIGQALNFDVYWDGYNLLNELTKVVSLI